MLVSKSPYAQYHGHVVTMLLKSGQEYLGLFSCQDGQGSACTLHQAMKMQANGMQPVLAAVKKTSPVAISMQFQDILAIDYPDAQWLHEYHEHAAALVPKQTPTATGANRID